MGKRIRKWLPSRRRLIQLYAALLYNANLKGFVSGNIYTGKSKLMCVPGLNCYSCPGAVGACPLGALQGSFSAGHSTLYYVGGILMLYGLMFGRMICGWLCPFGLVQELCYKLPTPKLRKSPVTRVLSFLKYCILAVFVFLIPVLYAFRDTPLPAFCKYICPAGTMEGGLLLLSNKVNAGYFSMLGSVFTWKFLLMLSVAVSCVFVFRLFCRFLCPLGAIYGLFNRVSFFGIRLEEHKCIDCGKCLQRCEMDIRHVGDGECISCGACIDVCPTKAISFKGPKLLHPVQAQSEKSRTARNVTRCAVSAALAAVLLGAFLHFGKQAAPALPVQGNQVGDLCFSYELGRMDETGTLPQRIDPADSGTVTLINFWGTWCKPCIEELPYFDRIAEEYGEEVTVVAVHSSLSGQTAPEFIGKYYPDSSILFALDDPLDEAGLSGSYYTALGGRGTYPYTVVLDENGIITKIFLSSVTYEELKAAVEAAMNG